MFGKASGSYSASLELSSLNGTNGFVINGIDEDDYSGDSVSSAGDINNDGYDDIIIGAYKADPNGDKSGESYVVFGKATGYSASLELSSLNGTNGFVINGIDASDRVVVPCPLLVTSTTMDTMTSSLGQSQQTLMVTPQVSPMSCLARHQELTQHLSNCRL